MSPVKKDLRDRISRLLDEIDDDRIRDLIDLALSGEKDAWATCTNCKHRIPIKIPDLGARAKILEVLANQGKGKPKETVRHEGEVGIKAVKEMTLNELDDEEKRILEAHPELLP